MYFFFLTESSILVLKGVNSMVDQHSIVLKKIIKNKNQKRMAKQKKKKEKKKFQLNSIHIKKKKKVSYKQNQKICFNLNFPVLEKKNQNIQILKIFRRYPI